jgi:hypothetical protein
MSESHSEKDNNSEGSPCIWEDVQRQMNVTFISEENVEAVDSLLLCAVQEIDYFCFEDNNTETDDEEEEAAVREPILKCAEAMHWIHATTC